jgi:uncharacterized membrane protein
MTFKPRRFKSIDIFRGTCMAWMFLGHLLDWWLKPEFFAIRNSVHMLLDSVGASGFLFISGVSITLSYKNQMHKAKTLNAVPNSSVKLTYFIRSALFLLIALLYNLTIALSKGNLSWIWSWYVLMTIAFSMMIIWPLFKTPIVFRAILGLSIWLLSNFLYGILSPFQGKSDTFGILYYLFFNPYNQDPFLNFFSFFLFGTIIGEILSKSNFERDDQKLKSYLNKQLFRPFLLIGPILIIIGILLNFPYFLVRSSLSWLIYTLGLTTTLLVVLFFFEEQGYFATKRSYKLLFYYSYYSFTVYLGHNLLFFVCSNCMNLVSSLIVIMITFVLVGLIFNQIYKYWGWKASIKSIISRLSTFLAHRIESKKTRM